MGIVRFALRFPHTFYVVAALILFLGVAAIRSMPTDIFPEINIPVVTVIWQFTGLSTPEMEQRVSTYSQYATSASVNGIKNMEVQTLNGLSIQKIFFQPDVNIDLAIAQIVSATNSIRALMPRASSLRSSCNSTRRAFLFCSSVSNRTASTRRNSTTTASTAFGSNWRRCPARILQRASTPLSPPSTGSPRKALPISATLGLFPTSGLAWTAARLRSASLGP
jgi:multidrug efflux pump subunit AcrB